MNAQNPYQAMLHPAHRAGARLAPGLACLGRIATLASALLLGACAESSYYWQSVMGHWDVMRAAQPVDELLAQQDLEPELRERLRMASKLRRYAVKALGLPDNASYQTYSDIQRPYVVWNVVATASDSLELKTWCFPVMGCVGYRGYYAQGEAQQFAQGLRDQGLEVYVYGVPAYSTLGWLNWAGGDPLPSSLTRLAEPDMARLLFHELAHQVLYVGSDTMFDESFATAVERIGLRQWLDSEASAQTRLEYAQSQQRRQQFQALTRQTRDQLLKLYEAARARPSAPRELAQEKERVMSAFRLTYEEIKVLWGGWGGYDRWVAQANNPAFALQAAYDGHAGAFEALFEQCGRKWPAFYAAARELAQRPPDERQQALAALERGERLPEFQAATGKGPGS